MHLRGGPAPADSEFGAHLGGHRLPVVDTPLLTIAGAVLARATLAQPAGRQEAFGDGYSLPALRPPHGVQQTRLVSAFEHVFDSTTGW